MEDYSYIGSGQVYLRVRNALVAMLAIGNCSALSFAVAEDEKDLKDHTQPGGGTYNEVRRINSVEASLTLHDLSPENLARALYGSSSAIATGSVTDESHTMYAGGFTPTNYPASAIGTVKKGVTTLVANTDYTVVPGGIIAIAGGAFADGDIGLISYTKAAADVIQALTTAGQEYELIFAGLNEARSGKEVRVTVYRTKLGAAKDLGLITDDYASLAVAGKVLKDTSKTGAGISQYFKVEVVR